MLRGGLSLPGTRGRLGRGIGRAGGAVAAAGPDTTAPTITSTSAPTVNENSILSHTLTANEAVTWTKTGGADAALFTLTGNNLSMIARDYESPADADTNNVYLVQVTATDGAGNATIQNISVTVLDVAEGVTYSPALQLNDARNSQYLALLAA